MHNYTFNFNFLLKFQVNVRVNRVLKSSDGRNSNTEAFMNGEKATLISG